MNEYKKLQEYLDNLIAKKINEFQKGTKVNGKGIEYIEKRKNKLDKIINIMESGNYNEIAQQEQHMKDLKEILNFIFNYNNENETGINYIIEFFTAFSKLLKYKDLDDEPQIKDAKQFMEELLQKIKTTRDNQIIKLENMKNQLEYSISTYKKYKELFDEKGLKRGLTKEEYIIFTNFIKNSDLPEEIIINLIEKIIKENYKSIQKQKELQLKLKMAKISNNATRILNEIDSIISLEERTQENTTTPRIETNIGTQTTEKSEERTPENENITPQQEEISTNIIAIEQAIFTEEEKNIINQITKIKEELINKYSNNLNSQTIDNLVSEQQYSLEIRRTIYESTESEKWKLILYDLITNLKIEKTETKESIIEIYKYIIEEYNKEKEKQKINIPKLSKEKYEQIKDLLIKLNPLKEEYDRLNENDKNTIESIYVSAESGINPEEISQKFSVLYVKTIKDIINLITTLKEYNEYTEETKSFSEEELQEWIPEFDYLVKKIETLFECLKQESALLETEKEEIICKEQITTETSPEETDEIDTEQLDLDSLPLTDTRNVIIFFDEFLNTTYKEKDYEEIMTKEKIRIKNAADTLNKFYKIEGTNFMGKTLSEPVMGEYETTLKPRATRTGSVRTSYITASVSEKNKRKIFELLGNKYTNAKEFKNCRIFLIIGYVRKYGNSEVYDEFNKRISEQATRNTNGVIKANKIQEFQEKLNGDLTDEELKSIVSMIECSYDYFIKLIEEGKKMKRTTK